jgi:hypothetical protein
VEEEVPGSSLAGSDRWYIISLSMRVGGLEVVETKNLFLILDYIKNSIINLFFWEIIK